MNAMDPVSEASYLSISYPGNDSIWAQAMSTSTRQDNFKELLANASQEIQFLTF